MANIYTSAAELGLPDKAERNKDAVRAEMLCQRLAAFALNQPAEDGQIPELDAVRVQAAKILIDKGKPNLSAVEQVNYEGETSTEAVEAKLGAIIRAKPDLLQRILGRLAQEQQHTPKALEVDTNVEVGTQPKTGTGAA